MRVSNPYRAPSRDLHHAEAFRRREDVEDEGLELDAWHLAVDRRDVLFGDVVLCMVVVVVVPNPAREGS